MQLLSFRQPYEMLPPVPEAQMLTHGLAYQYGTFWRDIGLEDIDQVLAQDGTFVWVGLREPSASFLKKIQGTLALHALAAEPPHQNFIQRRYSPHLTSGLFYASL
jgi:hypothetical protein